MPHNTQPWRIFMLSAVQLEVVGFSGDLAQIVILPDYMDATAAMLFNRNVSPTVFALNHIIPGQIRARAISRRLQRRCQQTRNPRPSIEHGFARLYSIFKASETGIVFGEKHIRSLQA